jgi:hypothetical protein
VSVELKFAITIIAILAVTLSITPTLAYATSSATPAPAVPAKKATPAPAVPAKDACTEKTAKPAAAKDAAKPAAAKDAKKAAAEKAPEVSWYGLLLSWLEDWLGINYDYPVTPVQGSCK